MRRSDKYLSDKDIQIQEKDKENKAVVQQTDDEMADEEACQEISWKKQNG